MKELLPDVTTNGTCAASGKPFTDFSNADGPICPTGHRVGMDKGSDWGLAQSLIMGPDKFDLIETASTNRCVALRRLAIGELVWVWDLDPAKGSNVVIRAFRDADPICRRLAIGAEFFSKVVPDGSIREAARDPSYIVRQGIVKAIGNGRVTLTGKADFAAIVQLLDDPDLKETTVKALETASGVKLGQDKAAWLDWLNEKYDGPDEQKGK